MTEKSPQRTKIPNGATDPDRLVAALRANLHRRKAQARARRNDAPTPRDSKNISEQEQ